MTVNDRDAPLAHYTTHSQYQDQDQFFSRDIYSIKKRRPCAVMIIAFRY